MRPLDIFSEKSIRDGSPDKIACSSALVYEAHSLAIQSQFHKTDAKAQDVKHPHGEKAEDFNSAVGFGKRDQMALASLFFGSPLMMLGMGAALGVSDTMRMSKEHALKEGHHSRRLRQVSLEKTDAPKERTLLSMPTDNVAARMSFRPDASRKSGLEFKNRKENVLYPSQWRQPDPEKSWVKASKLVKRKQQMMDQLAKCRGLLQLNVVSAILSKIDLLDKELKKMGC
jgi:hypothetical protein